MKRNIDVVKIGKDAAGRIIDYIRREKPDGTGEFVQGLTNLQNGISSSLIVELDGSSSDTFFSQDMEFGQLLIQPAARRVTEGGRDISLTPKEFDILCFLASHSGQVFTKEQIYQEVWATSYCMDDSNIMAFIRKLRKKIEPEPDSPMYILTVWGTGYKFNDKLH